MSRILIVEDSPTQALEIQYLLEDAGFEADVATNGREALAAIGRCVPDLVLTDLQMPELDGLRLVDAVRSRHPLIPVVLMTGIGSEEIAAEALQRGASGYVPKRRFGRDLISTLTKILEISAAGRTAGRVVEGWVRCRSEFVLNNDAGRISRLVNHLTENLARMQMTDETGAIRVGVALTEALLNAMYHGNLEVSSDLKELDDHAFEELARARRRQSPYRERKLYLSEVETAEKVTYVIRDEGPGFDPADLADPSDPANLERTVGRGLLLIRTFMDEARHNAAGNELTMVKRRESSPKALAAQRAFIDATAGD